MSIDMESRNNMKWTEDKGMKRYLGVLLCLAMALMLGVLPGAAEGKRYKSEGFRYYLDEQGNAYVDAYAGRYTGDIVEWGHSLYFRGASCDWD